MRKVRLCESDFTMFDNEITPIDFDFFQRHKDAFRRMWLEQDKDFWVKFVSTFRVFSESYGVIKDFIGKPEQHNAFIDQAFCYIDENYVFGKFSMAKNLILDIVCTAQNRHNLHFMESKSVAKDPFYNKDTRDVFRKLFGPAGDKSSYMKVYFLIPVYLRFGGSVCECLRRWLDAEEMEPGDESYWQPPKETTQIAKKEDNSTSPASLPFISDLGQIGNHATVDVDVEMFLREKLEGRPDGPSFVKHWCFGDPRFDDKQNPLYNPQCDPKTDWRDKLEFKDFQLFLDYVDKTYGPNVGCNTPEQVLQTIKQRVIDEKLYDKHRKPGWSNEKKEDVKETTPKVESKSSKKKKKKKKNNKSESEGKKNGTEKKETVESTVSQVQKMNSESEMCEEHSSSCQQVAPLAGETSAAESGMQAEGPNKGSIPSEQEDMEVELKSQDINMGISKAAAEADLSSDEMTPEKEEDEVDQSPSKSPHNMDSDQTGGPKKSVVPLRKNGKPRTSRVKDPPDLVRGAKAIEHARVVTTTMADLLRYQSATPGSPMPKTVKEQVSKIRRKETTRDRLRRKLSEKEGRLYEKSYAGDRGGKMSADAREELVDEERKRRETQAAFNLQDEHKMQPLMRSASVDSMSDSSSSEDSFSSSPVSPGITPPTTGTTNKVLDLQNGNVIALLDDKFAGMPSGIYVEAIRKPPLGSSTMKKPGGDITLYLPDDDGDDAITSADPPKIRTPNPESVNEVNERLGALDRAILERGGAISVEEKLQLVDAGKILMGKQRKDHSDDHPKKDIDYYRKQLDDIFKDGRQRPEEDERIELNVPSRLEIRQVPPLPIEKMHVATDNKVQLLPAPSVDTVSQEPKSAVPALPAPVKQRNFSEVTVHIENLWKVRSVPADGKKTLHDAEMKERALDLEGIELEQKAIEFKENTNTIVEKELRSMEDDVREKLFSMDQELTDQGVKRTIKTSSGKTVEAELEVEIQVKKTVESEVKAQIEAEIMGKQMLKPELKEIIHEEIWKKQMREAEKRDKQRREAEMKEKELKGKNRKEGTDSVAGAVGGEREEGRGCNHPGRQGRCDECLLEKLRYIKDKRKARAEDYMKNGGNADLQTELNQEEKDHLLERLCQKVAEQDNPASNPDGKGEGLGQDKREIKINFSFHVDDEQVGPKIPVPVPDAPNLEAKSQLADLLGETLLDTLNNTTKLDQLKDVLQKGSGPTEANAKEDADKKWKVEFMETIAETTAQKLQKNQEKENKPSKRKKKLRNCTTCEKEEPKPKTYMKCQKCKEHRVKDVRYYCSRDCQSKDWKAKHKLEHKENKLETLQPQPSEPSGGGKSEDMNRSV